MPPTKSNKFKTSRFPAARIKRIMQLDEEVGKLASATPVMISKSLECFIQVLLDETCKEVRNGTSRKLTAGHLKQMINANPNFDFLLEIVDSIPDLPEPKPASGPSRARKPSGTAVPKSGSLEDDNAEGEDGDEPKKPKKRGRKKVDKEEQRGDEVDNWLKTEQERLGGTSAGVAPGWAGAQGMAAGPSDQQHLYGTLAGPSTAVQGQASAGNPVIMNWKRDMTGGGGTGEGGRGMFDDYEEDDDDY